MKYLLSQDEFEVLIGRQPSSEPLPDLTIIWFTATWCGPCKRINIDYLQDFPANWLKCDIDQNDYTAGFCGIRSVPSFLAVYKKKVIGTKSSSSTVEIWDWLQNLVLN